jgi:hypothetical protein
MGAMVRFLCEKCRFESGVLCLGPAPFPEQHDPVLATCKKCQNLVAVNRLDKIRKCPVCARRVRVAGSSLACPRCAGPLMEQTTGYWD